MAYVAVIPGFKSYPTAALITRDRMIMGVGVFHLQISHLRGLAVRVQILQQFSRGRSLFRISLSAQTNDHVQGFRDLFIYARGAIQPDLYAQLYMSDGARLCMHSLDTGIQQYCICALLIAKATSLA